MTNTTMQTVPQYSESKGWTGGDARALYAITDVRTGRTIVRPVEQMTGVGPAVTVAQATRAQAEELWQSPLHSGWKVTA